MMAKFIPQEQDVSPRLIVCAYDMNVRKEKEPLEKIVAEEHLSVAQKEIRAKNVTQLGALRRIYQK